MSQATLLLSLDQSEMAAIILKAMSCAERPSKSGAVALPSSKAELPKVLCLDLNKWIDLSCAYHGREKGKPFQEALRVARAAVESGRLVVPVFAQNLEEASAARDRGQRERLAEFMVDLSRNLSVVHSEVLVRQEIYDAMLDVIMQKPRGCSLRSRLLHWGMNAAAGVNATLHGPGKQLCALHDEVAAMPEVSRAMIIDAHGWPSKQSVRKIDVDSAHSLWEIQHASAGLAPLERRRQEVNNLMRAQIMTDVARSLGITLEALCTAVPEGERRETFVRSIPGLNVMLELLVRRDRNLCSKPHRNDHKDLAFLRVAIPYGSIVVTENGWAHLARQAKLDEYYNTRVLADLRELPRELERAGVL